MACHPTPSQLKEHVQEDQRMQDGIQLVPQASISKHHASKLSTIDLLVLVEHVSTKTRDQKTISVGSFLRDLACDLVRIDDGNVVLPLPSLDDGALTSGDATGDAYDPHLSLFLFFKQLRTFPFQEGKTKYKKTKEEDAKDQDLCIQSKQFLLTNPFCAKRIPKSLGTMSNEERDPKKKKRERESIDTIPNPFFFFFSFDPTLSRSRTIGKSHRYPLFDPSVSKRETKNEC